MGLSKEAAREVRFESSDKPGEAPSKKVSIVNYFMERVSNFSYNLIVVQCSSQVRRIALYCH
jgi:hypothetical protein